MKRVLVTGATGFCGQYLCRALASKGYEVVGTCRKQPGLPKPSWRLISIDLKSRTAVESLIRDLRPDYLFHLAAQSSAQHSWKIPDETFAVNVGATLNLLNALRGLSPKTCLLFASSIQVYGRFFHEKVAAVENGFTWPENPYSASKRTAELACLDFFNRFGLKVVIARMVNHTGPGQEPHFVFSDWCRQIALAEKRKQAGKLEVGNLNVERDFLHVRDVVNAWLVLMTKGKAGQIYNVAAGKTVHLKKYADRLSRLSSVDFKLLPVKSRMRGCEPAKTLISSSKIRSLGWKPEQTVGKALAELLADWRKRVHNE